MKKRVTIFVMCFLFGFGVSAQIYEGDVKVSTQAEVDALAAVFVEKTEISGAVFIGEEFGKESNISDLSVFQSIKKMDSVLIIKNNPLLESLSGLDSLQHIGSELIITGNTALTSYCSISGFSFDEATLYPYFYINGNGYDADVDNFAMTCSGQLSRPELKQTFIPDWKPGEGGPLAVPDFGESTSDFVGLYLKENIFSSNAFSSGGSLEMILAPTDPGNYESLTVECSEDNVTWADFMDNRSEPAVITSTAYPVVSPNKAYYYRLRADNGDLSNVIYVDRFAHKAAFSSTGFGGSPSWPPMYINGSYRIYDNDEGWLGGTDNTKLKYQWFRVNPVTFEFITIDGATDSQYYPQEEDMGYKIAATISLDGDFEGVNHYASYTYMSYDAMKVPLPAYLSNVTSEGFNLNLYNCISGTFDINGFDIYAFAGGEGGNVQIDSIIPSDSCGVYHFVADVPQTVDELELMYYPEVSPAWSFKSAEEFGHYDMLMWRGVVGFYSGDVLLHTQEQVNVLVETLAGYTGISGNLGIYGKSDVVDKSLTQKSLAAVLTDYDLNQSFTLVEVNQDADEDPIVDLSAFSSLGLSGIAGDLRVENTTHLSSLDGLELISLVSGNIIVANNAALSSLDGLNSIAYADTVEVSENPVLLDYSALVMMQEYLDSIEITGNFYNPTANDIATGHTDTTASVIYLSGNVAFGTATVGESAEVELRVSNTGNKSLSITAITVPAGFFVDWTGGTIASGTSQVLTITFAPTEAVDYTGKISFTGDFDLGEHEVTLMGRGVVSSDLETITENEVTVFPNPFNDFIRLQTIENVKSIRLYSTLGKQVLEQINPSEQLNTTSLEAGMYFIHIENNDGHTTTDVVIKE